VLRAKERAPILSPSDVSTFGLAIESIKEFGGASLAITINIIHSLFLKFLMFNSLFNSQHIDS
jgi:hypothetical protein